MHPARRSLLISPHVDFDAIHRSAAQIGEAKKSPNTRAAYYWAWRAFLTWCEAAQVSALPAEPNIVKDFATWCLEQGYRISTVTQRVIAIASYHRDAGLPSPLSEEVSRHLQNARRHFKQPLRSKRAITGEMLRKMIPRFPDTTKGIRDRAMVLVTFAAGWRRSETVSLYYSDVRFVPSGLELWLRSSKTDQMAEGRVVGIHPGNYPATCPIAALRAWLTLRGTWDGPLFPRLTMRSEISRDALAPHGEPIHLAVKKHVEAIGEDPRLFGAHSLRAGMITEAAKNGASEAAIMQRTGHKRSSSLRRYIRPATAFDFNPLKGVL